MPDPMILRTNDGNACMFRWDVAENEFAGKSAGRPIFDKVLIMTVWKPGDRDSKPEVVIERHMDEVELLDKENKKYLRPAMVVYYDGETKVGVTKDNPGQLQRGKWRDIMKPQLDAWESMNGDGGKLSGTPLNVWPHLSVNHIASLKAVGIHTVEAIADVQDSLLHNLGHNGRTLRDQAKVFLARAADGAQAEKLAADKAEMQVTIDNLQRQLLELASKIDEPKRGPGRPPKQADAA